MDKDFYIYQLPVETTLGNVRFLKYYEYTQNLYELSIMSMNTLHFYYHQKKQYEHVTGEARKEIDESLSKLKNKPLFDIVSSDPLVTNIYYKIFKMVLDEENHSKLEDVFDSEDLFMELRELVLGMQMIPESEVNPNEEIQSYIDAGREVQLEKNEKQSCSDIMSSIVIGSGIDYDVIMNWNAVRVYAAYYRLGVFKNSDITALFATVSDKIKYETWQKSIDLFENKKAGMKMSEFNKQYGGLFG